MTYQEVGGSVRQEGKLNVLPVKQGDAPRPMETLMPH